MALYNRTFLKKTKFLRASEHEQFGKPYHPGSDVDLAGIYRCDSCGFEILKGASGKITRDFFLRPSPTGAMVPQKPANKVCWHLVIALENWAPQALKRCGEQLLRANDEANRPLR